MTRLVQRFGARPILCGLTSSALAQPEQPAPLPPVELGVGVDAALMREGLYLDTGMVLEPMVNVRVTKPLTANLAFEVTFAVGGTPTVRTEVQGVGLAWAPVGMRISTSVSIPFARYQ